MKVLLRYEIPFAFAHGGMQTQIEQTKAALEANGIQAEFLRWWDASQRGDVVICFGRPRPDFIVLAHQRGCRVVISDLLTAQGSRPAWKLALHRYALLMANTLLPEEFGSGFSSQPYKLCDAVFVLTPWEAHLAKYVYGAAAEKVHVIPNGVEQHFLEAPERPRGKWLLCTATIAERKRVLELAQAAVIAETPLFIVGKPYSERDHYFLAFIELVKKNPEFIRYEGAISNRQELASIYREARGFVLLSTMESLSLSALEAAACESPLLLSDLPWARATFGSAAFYCPISSINKTAVALRAFYKLAPTLPKPPRPVRWTEIGNQIRKTLDILLSH